MRRTVVTIVAAAVLVVITLIAVPRGAGRHPAPASTRNSDSTSVTSPRVTPSIDAFSPVVLDLAARLAGGRAVIDGVDFIGSSDVLETGSDAALSRLAAALAQTPGTFLIEAHVPSSGDVLSDQAVTDRRATVIRERLVAAGVPAERLFAMGFGASRASVHEGRARIEVSRMP